MAGNYSVADLSEEELKEIRKLEEKLNRGNADEIALVAYQEQDSSS